MENKSKKFIKGSEEAKEFMANLSSKRGSKEEKKQLKPHLIHLIKKIKKSVKI